jgi:putative SOS response-associated peptidase YedK
MCGRVLVSENKDIIITGRDGRKFTPKPSGTGNPGSMLPVVTDAMPGKVQQFRWGLLTPEDNTIHSKHKHARIESLHTVGLWRQLLGRKHCVIRIQAFFEYNKSHKILYRVERADGKPFYIAGLWDIWMDVQTNVLLPTFAMITMPANRAMADVHDRMPAILERSHIKTWLNPDYTGTQRSAFLQSAPCLSETLKITVEKDHQESK